MEQQEGQHEELQGGQWRRGHAVSRLFGAGILRLGNVSRRVASRVATGGKEEREHAVSCGLFACARLRVRMHRQATAQGAPATRPRKQDARWAAVNGWWSQRVNWLVTESERARTDRCSEEFVCLRYGLTLTSQHSGPLDGNPFLNPPQAGLVTASR